MKSLNGSVISEGPVEGPFGKGRSAEDLFPFRTG